MLDLHRTSSPAWHHHSKTFDVSCGVYRGMRWSYLSSLSVELIHYTKLMFRMGQKQLHGGSLLLQFAGMLGQVPYSAPVPGTPCRLQMNNETHTTQHFKCFLEHCQHLQWIRYQQSKEAAGGPIWDTLVRYHS